MPRPTATPFTAATIGFGNASIAPTNRAEAVLATVGPVPVCRRRPSGVAEPAHLGEVLTGGVRGALAGEHDDREVVASGSLVERVGHRRCTARCRTRCAPPGRRT